MSGEQGKLGLSSGSEESSVADHPAYVAWSAVQKQSRLPKRICRLYPDRFEKRRKLKKESTNAAFRMEGALTCGKSVIAKRGWHESIQYEQIIYEKILQFLPLDSLNFYGSFKDGERWWLFLEDSEGREWSASVTWQNEAVAEWLAVMHVRARQFGEVLKRLPEKGPSFYRGQLQRADKLVNTLSEYVHASEESRSYLSSLIENMVAVDAHWSRIEAICRTAPRTLVHNDIQPKNIHFSGEKRRTSRLLVFDWEMAGFGVPCTDIYCLSQRGSDPDALLSTYQRALSTDGGRLTLSEIECLAAIGGVFRILDSITWLERTHFAVEFGSSKRPPSDYMLERYSRNFAKAVRSVLRLA